MWRWTAWLARFLRARTHQTGSVRPGHAQMADHMIDNFSANHVNTATTQEEKQLNEGLDAFSGSSSSCCGPRSLSLASRMTSVAPCGGCRSWQHLRLDRVVWQVSGRYRKAQHRCVLFGTTSSMAAWWQFGRLSPQPGGHKLAWRSHALAWISAACLATV